LGWILWEAFREDKGARERWDFFKNSLLETQNQSSPLKVREVGRARDPVGLTVSF